MSQILANRDRSPLSLDAIRARVPSVFAEGKRDGLSDRYAFISTAEVLRTLSREGFLPVAAREARVVDQDKKGFTKHEVRLRQARDIGRQLAVGDVFPEVILTNSHDGSSAYRFEGGLFRLACSNGMCLPEAGVARVSVRHTGQIESEVIDGCISVVEDAQRFADKALSWQGIHLTTREQEAFAQAALGLRWDADEFGVVQAPIAASRLLATRRWDDNGDDLYRVFNRVQEGLTKGGQKGRASNGRRIGVREVTGIDQNIKLNRALSSLAEEMARLKGA